MSKINIPDEMLEETSRFAEAQSEGTPVKTGRNRDQKDG